MVRMVASYSPESRYTFCGNATCEYNIIHHAYLVHIYHLVYTRPYLTTKKKRIMCMTYTCSDTPALSRSINFVISANNTFFFLGSPFFCSSSRFSFLHQYPRSSAFGLCFHTDFQTSRGNASCIVPSSDFLQFSTNSLQLNANNLQLLF
jgi:hypothetical protein